MDSYDRQKIIRSGQTQQRMTKGILIKHIRMFIIG